MDYILIFIVGCLFGWFIKFVFSDDMPETKPNTDSEETYKGYCPNSYSYCDGSEIDVEGYRRCKCIRNNQKPF